MYFPIDFPKFEIFCFQARIPALPAVGAEVSLCGCKICIDFAFQSGFKGYCLYRLLLRVQPILKLEFVFVHGNSRSFM